MGEKPKQHQVKDYLYFQYGKSIYEAMVAGLIHISDLNAFEMHAVEFYKHLTGMPFEKQIAKSWDEKIADEITAAHNSTEPTSIKPR